jgi:E3 ubiquitin-protein ligase DOA10
MDRVTGDRIDSNENLREEAEVDSMTSLTKSDNTDANSESILITPQLEIIQQKSFENVSDQNDGTVLCIETKSKVDSIEDIETACCRVCHGESQPDNQLFYPCKCDGSIKYVHQQCLMEWLKVKKRQQQLSKPRCELCGEIFVFQNIYAAGAPTCLTTFEIIRELLPRVLSVVSALLNAGLSFFFWCICLPLFTNCIIKVCWCVVTEENEDLGGKTQKECISSSFPTLESFDSFSFAWYNGIVNLCVIVAVTVVCFEVGQVIYRVRQNYGVPFSSYFIVLIFL